MPQAIRPLIIAGLASAGLFVLLSLLGFTGLFLIFSSLPLLYIGYTHPFTPAMITAAIASFILLLFSPISSLFYIITIAVPSLFILAHWTRGHSLIAPITDICAYMIILITGLQWSMVSSGGIQHWLSEAFKRVSFEDMDPAIVNQLSWLSGDGSYLLIGMAAWWSVIFLLTAIWLLGKLQKHPLKPASGYFSPQDLPAWLLPGLIAAIATSFLGSENLRFLGLFAFVIMLLPYVFVGAMYTPLKKALEHSLGWSLVICVLMAVLAWPAIIVATLGVFKHTKQLIIKE